jgi:hypothetical protein
MRAANRSAFEALVVADDPDHESLRPGEHAGYFQVTSMPKKCMKTSRLGLFLGFCCGLRM